MRISDWSADVCASDLLGSPRVLDGDRLQAVRPSQGGDASRNDRESLLRGEAFRSVGDIADDRDPRGDSGQFERLAQRPPIVAGDDDALPAEQGAGARGARTAERRVGEGGDGAW